MRRLAVTAAVVLGFFPSSAAWAESSVDKARALMRESGVEAMLLQFMDQSMTNMMPLLRQGLRDVPPGFMGLAEDEMRAGFRQATGDFLSVGVSEYANSFTEAEIDQLRAFYQTEAGRKLVRLQPALMERTTAQGVVIGRRVGEDAMKRAIKRFEAGERKP